MGFAAEFILIIRVGGIQHPLLKLLAEIPLPPKKVMVAIVKIVWLHQLHRNGF